MSTEITGKNDDSNPVPQDLPEDTISLDYAKSDSAEELDMGIRETIEGIRLSILAIGLGLATMKAKNLFKDLGCKTMAGYIKSLCDETKMERSTIFNWLYIGEAYLKYQKELRKIGFSENDGPTKLPYLERALLNNQKADVYKNIKSMTVRDFAAYSRSSITDNPDDKPYVTIKDDQVYINGILAVKINSRLSKFNYNHFRKINLVAGKAMSNGEMVYLVRLHDIEEVKLYEKASKYLLQKIRQDL